MRVFVVGTGRCGSVTFSKACAHATNYTVSHEGVFQKRDSLFWPNDHVAVEPSLWPLIPLLRKKYPALVLVHLLREDRDAFVQSYRQLDSPTFEGAKHYRLHERLPEAPNYEGAPPTIDVWASCHVGAGINEEERLGNIGLFYDAVNALIRAMRPQLTVTLETAAADWPGFWNLIRAEGDYVASLAEWELRHNSEEARRPT